MDLAKLLSRTSWSLFDYQLSVDFLWLLVGNKVMVGSDYRGSVLSQILNPVSRILLHLPLAFSEWLFNWKPIWFFLLLLSFSSSFLGPGKLLIIMTEIYRLCMFYDNANARLLCPLLPPFFSFHPTSRTHFPPPC